MAAEKPDKREKKSKTSKRAETDGVTKASKKDKKDKKDKKKLEKKLTEAHDLDEELQASAVATVVKAKSAAQEEDEGATDIEVEAAATTTKNIETTMVPFALPIATDKHAKKVFKCVKKSAKAKTLKRGVKEVVKTLRKSAAAGPNNTAFPGVVVIAADISPMDVISHIPVLCEDHNVPYIFVTSRVELGAAGATKRPTSVVMVCEKTASKKEVKKDEVEEFSEAYKELVKLVQKETLKQVKQ